MPFFSKKLLFVLFIIFVFQFFCFSLALAQSDVQFTPGVSIPNSDPSLDIQKGTILDIPNNTSLIAKYIKGFFVFGISALAILSVVMVAWGGIQWLTAGGNAGQITNAKTTILGALGGLILGLSSYIILQTVNPDLVNFKIKSVGIVNRREFDLFCHWSAMEQCVATNQYYGADIKCSVTDKPQSNYICCCTKDANYYQNLCQKFITKENCESEEGCMWYNNKCYSKQALGILACSNDNDNDCSTGNVCNMWYLEAASQTYGVGRCMINQSTAGGCCLPPGAVGEKCAENNDCQNSLKCNSNICQNPVSIDVCQRCGEGLFNVCDEQECKSLGPNCAYDIRGSLFGNCYSK